MRARARAFVGAFALGPACLAACGEPGYGPAPEVAEDRDPAWSPDGAWIAVQHSVPGGAAGIHLLGVETGEREILLSGFAASQPEWSPDGQTIVGSAGFRLFRIDMETRRIDPIGPDGFSVDPAFSPDGRTIAFTSDGGVDPHPPRLWLMNADGSDLRRIPLPAPHSGMRDPDWSPTGDRIVGSVQGASFQRLFVTDTLGRDTAYLTPPTANTVHPAWSPDGQWIAYVKGQPGRAGELWLIRPDGTDDHRVIRGPATHPSWSPDGQRIAFARLERGELAVWTVGIDGSGLTKQSSPGSLRAGAGT